MGRSTNKQFPGIFIYSFPSRPISANIASVIVFHDKIYDLVLDLFSSVLFQNVCGRILANKFEKEIDPFD